MPRLVLHDVGVDRAGQRVAGLVADRLEGGERQAFDQHLHAEIGHVPAAVGQRLLEQRLQRLVDRIGELELLVQQALVGLDVARLVHHLGGGVELGVHVGHGGDDLGGGDQGALLAMHELRDRVGLQVAAQPRPLLLGHPAPIVRVVDRDRLVLELHRIVRVELERPVEPRAGIPLLLLALFVEVEQVGRAVVVFPVELDVGGAVELPVGDLDRQGIDTLGAHDGPSRAGVRCRCQVDDASLTLWQAASADAAYGCSR